MLDDLLNCGVVVFQHEATDLLVHGGGEHNLLTSHFHEVDISDLSGMSYLTVNCLCSKHYGQIEKVVVIVNSRENSVRQCIERADKSYVLAQVFRV